MIDSQTRFKEGETVKITELERLQILRQRYYDILMNEITLNNNRKKEHIESYKNTVKELDKEIEKQLAKKRLKS